MFQIFQNLQHTKSWQKKNRSPLSLHGQKSRWRCQQPYMFFDRLKLMTCSVRATTHEAALGSEHNVTCSLNYGTSALQCASELSSFYFFEDDLCNYYLKVSEHDHYTTQWTNDDFISGLQHNPKAMVPDLSQGTGCNDKNRISDSWQTHRENVLWLLVLWNATCKHFLAI